MDMIDDFIDRKLGKKPIEYLHPNMEKILRPTYGVMVYQEQVMQIANEIAGFTLAQADMMRRAMGKKDKDLMAEQKKQFVEGAATKSIDRKLAGEIFDLIDKFASYGFNKSHSAAYSVLAYQTAYLKAYFTAEFMAATLTSEIGDINKMTLLLDECRKQKIEVLGPDVNESHATFSVTDGKLRVGLSAIKNVGVGAAEEINRARTEGGKFENVFDFVARVDLKSVNKRALEGLIKAGAFDSLGHRRAQLANSFERIVQFGLSVQESRTSSQSSLFDLMNAEEKKLATYPTLDDVPEWSQGEKLNREKELLGVYISGHPLLKFEQEYNSFTNIRIGDASTLQGVTGARAAGIVVDVRRKIDRKGNTMAFVQLEDFTGKGELIFFSDAYAKYQGILYPDSIILVSGKAESNGDSVRIMVSEAHLLEEAASRFTKSIAVTIDSSDKSRQSLSSLKQILGNHPHGNCSIFFSVTNGDSKPKLFRAGAISVTPDRKFMDELFEIFGKDNVRLLS
jgi:DNA polymerase-3 subunit alpha